MTPLTIYLARLFGLGLLLMCGLFAIRPDAYLATIQSMTVNPGLLLIAGISTLFGGLAMVIGHNRWSGGVLTVVVTALGWLTLLKGFAILAAPPQSLASVYGWMGYPRSFHLVMAAAALVSLWLPWAAFRAKPAPAT